MTWMLNRIIDLTPLSSWWSEKGEETNEEPIPVDVRIASWITENHVWISIASVAAALPKIRPRAGNYRGIARVILFFAVADLFFRGEGTAQQQCDAFRKRVQTALDGDKKNSYDEITQLYGGEAWQEIDRVCTNMAVDNPFKIADRCSWITKNTYSDATSQDKLITQASAAMEAWLKPEVKATFGRRTVNAIKLALPYYLAQFWN